MPVSGVFTGGNDGSTAASLSETLTFAGTEAAGDVAFIIPDAATGTATCSTSLTTTTEAGPNYSAGNVLAGYLFAETLGSLDITAGACVQTWTASTRNVGAGFATSGVSLAGIVLPGLGPVIQTTGNLTTRTLTTTVASSEVYVGIVSRSASATAPAVTPPGTYTLVTAHKTNFGTSPNSSVSIYRLTTPGAAGTYGGDTFTISSTPTHSIGYIWAVPPSVTNFNGTATVPLVDTITSAGAVGAATGSTLSETATVSSAGTVGAATGATLSLTDTVTAAGVVGASTGATVSPAVAITSAGVVGVSTGATVPLTDTITSAGAVGAATGSAVPLSVAFTAVGSVGGASPSAGSTVPLVDTISSAGAVGTSATAALALTDTFTAAGVVGTSTGSALALTDTVSSSGVVGKSTGAAVPLTYTITTAGLVGRSTGSAIAQTVTFIAAGTVTSPGTPTPGQMSSALGPVPTMAAALAPGGMSSTSGPTSAMTSTAGGSSAMSSTPGPTPSMAGS